MCHASETDVSDWLLRLRCINTAADDELFVSFNIFQIMFAMYSTL